MNSRYFSAEMDGFLVCYLRRVFFLFSFCLQIACVYQERTGDETNISVKHGRDWETRARWIRDSSHTNHLGSRFCQKGTVVSRSSLV